MKKFIFAMVCIATTLGLLTFISCSKDDEEISRQESATTEVRDFLNLVFPNEDAKPLYNFDTVSDTIVRIVSSLEDFTAHYTGEAPIPAINFDDHVLICGRVLMPEHPYSVKSMELRGTPTSSHLIIRTVKNNASWTVLYHMYFWGLFPKDQYEISSIEVIEG